MRTPMLGARYEIMMMLAWMAESVTASTLATPAYRGEQGAPDPRSGATVRAAADGSGAVLDPVLVLVDLAADRLAVLLRDRLRDRAGARDLALVD